MQQPESNILEEGRKYCFRVLKVITLHDNNKYFVIESEYKNKYLLNCALYKNYDIETGTTIRCKVDKINCSGRTFLEPEHPYLTENKEYVFEIKRVEELIDDEGENEQTLIVTDSYNRIYTAILDNYIDTVHLGRFVKAKLKKISKARLYLSDSVFI